MGVVAVRAKVITPEQVQAARGVLGFAEGPSGLGERPGSFTTHLIQALFSADMTNMNKLMVVYPEIVEAVYMYRFEDGGHTVLRYRAGLPR